MIKNKIKRWLGIDEIEQKLFEPYPILKIRGLIGEAIETALNGYQDNTTDTSTLYQNYFGENPHVRNKLLKTIYDTSVSTSTKIITETIEKRIYNEQFIDEIVQRIKNKQLT